MTKHASFMFVIEPQNCMYYFSHFSRKASQNFLYKLFRAIALLRASLLDSTVCIIKEKSLQHQQQKFALALLHSISGIQRSLNRLKL